MTKRECERSRNFFIFAGVVFIALGLSAPFRSEPEGIWQWVLMIVSTILLIFVGWMQFRLAAVLHKRAQRTRE